MPDIPENTPNMRGDQTQSNSGFGKMVTTKLLAHKLIPFMIYLALWGVIYIGNRHYAQQVELEINDLQEQLQTYRAEYLTMKAELMFKTKQSEVAKMVDSMHLHPLTTPPEKLKVEESAKTNKTR